MNTDVSLSFVHVCYCLEEKLTEKRTELLKREELLLETSGLLLMRGLLVTGLTLS